VLSREDAIFSQNTFKIHLEDLYTRFQTAFSKTVFASGGFPHRTLFEVVAIDRNGRDPEAYIGALHSLFGDQTACRIRHLQLCLGLNVREEFIHPDSWGGALGVTLVLANTAPYVISGFAAALRDMPAELSFTFGILYGDDYVLPEMDEQFVCVPETYALGKHVLRFDIPLRRVDLMDSVWKGAFGEENRRLRSAMQPGDYSLRE
jgi:hypothetical protein